MWIMSCFCISRLAPCVQPPHQQTISCSVLCAGVRDVDASMPPGDYTQYTPYDPEDIAATGIFADPQHFVLESLDTDTEDRMFGPVVFNVSGGSKDIVTAAMDHGWCFEQICQKRLSTFWTYLPANQAGKDTAVVHGRQTIRCLCIQACSGAAGPSCRKSSCVCQCRHLCVSALSFAGRQTL